MAATTRPPEIRMREAGDELLAPLRRLLKQLNLALQLFRLLAAALLGHALRQADEERELRERIGDHEQRHQTAEKILKMDGFQHD